MGRAAQSGAGSSGERLASGDGRLVADGDHAQSEKRFRGTRRFIFPGNLRERQAAGQAQRSRHESSKYLEEAR
jgi:hypothetical protein